MSDIIDPAVEAEYSLRPRHPERDAVYAAMRERGRPLRERHAATMDLRYGAGPRQLVDVFPAGAGTPLVVFFHGGYWRALDKETFAFLAGPLVEAGYSVALPGYDLAPAVTVPAIARQAGEALRFLVRNAAALGVDAGAVVISGHSAGAQLAAHAAFGGDRPAGLRAFVGVSGVYDLRPLLVTTIGGHVRLDAATATEMSPLDRAARHGGTPMRLVVGADETLGFRSQTERMAQAVADAGGAAETILVPGTNHFTVLWSLFDRPMLDFLDAAVGSRLARHG